MSLQSQERFTYDEGKRRCDYHADRKRNPGCKMELGCAYTDGIGTDRVEHRMTVGNLSAVSADNVPSHTVDGPDQDQGKQVKEKLTLDNEGRSDD